MGWDRGDSDEDYGESVSVRDCNQRRDWSTAADVLAALPEPWVIKDPRFCEHLDKWLPILKPYSPIVVWLTRDEAATAGSYERRGESVKTLERRLVDAQRHFDRWTGPKLQVGYEQVRAAISLFK